MKSTEHITFAARWDSEPEEYQHPHTPLVVKGSGDVEITCGLCGAEAVINRTN